MTQPPERSIMSSTYTVFCLSHDPAVLAVDELSLDEALSVAAERTPHHPSCDLAVVRYSGGPVEVGCPASPSLDAQVPRPHPGWHRDPVWHAVEWLRLAAAAHDVPASPALARALDHLPQCWPITRIRRLRTVIAY